MRKIGTLIMVVMCLFSCNEEVKDPCEGLILDIISQTLIIEILDDTGNNLIANGTYNTADIYTERDGFITRPVVYDIYERPNLPEELRNVVIAMISGDENGENVINIHLSEQEIDVLTMKLKIENANCSGVFYEIVQLIYNEQLIPLEDIGNNTYKIIVVK